MLIFTPDSENVQYGVGGMSCCCQREVKEFDWSPGTHVSDNTATQLNLRTF